MIDLRDVTTKDLTETLKNRYGVRVVEVSKNEVYKITAHGYRMEKERFIRGEGSKTILEVDNDVIK